MAKSELRLKCKLVEGPAEQNVDEWSPGKRALKQERVIMR